MTFAQLLVIFDREALGVDTQTARDKYEDDPSASVDTRRLELLYMASAEIAAMLEFPRVTISAAYVTGSNVVTLASEVIDVVGDEMVLAGLRLTRKTILEVVSARSIHTSPKFFSFDARESLTEIQIAGSAPNTAGTYAVTTLQPIDYSSLTSASEVWGGKFDTHQRMVADYAAITSWSIASLYGTAKLYEERFMKKFGALAGMLGKADALSLMHDRVNQLIELGGGVNVAQGSNQ